MAASATKVDVKNINTN